MSTDLVAPDSLIHGRFEKQVQSNPEKPALWARGQERTYAELNRQSNRLAHALIQSGIGPESLVGICLHRTVRLPVAMLAVLKAGGAYVPLDPAYPAERIGFTMEDSRARLLLTESSLRESLAGTGAELLLVDDPAFDDCAGFDANPHRGVEAENTAYVLFTSGSTGRPKGVAIAHTSVTALLDWARTEYPDAWLRHVLAATSICFDLSIFEIFLTLSRGGRVVMVDNALALPDVSTEVTLVNTVPSAVRELLRSGGIPPSVNTVNLAGEPLRNDLVQGLYKLGHVERVYNLYGPSEDTTYSTYTLCPRGVEDEPTIGKPVGGSSVLFLDEHANASPADEAGELCMAGDGLARGYLFRPGLTASKFTPHPGAGGSGVISGARIYHTGDLSRVNEAGDLLFLGRIDHQVKIRGFRIELGEIESALRKHDLVGETVVTAAENSQGDKLLAAYVQTLGADSPADTPPPEVDPPEAIAELRRHLANFLPDFMVPAVFVFMPRFPLTPNGKIDRKALPAPDLSSTGRRYDPPRNERERRITDAWAEALGRERVGVFDDFIEIGGDSISALRVLAAMRRAGEAVDQTALFTLRTPARLATAKPRETSVSNVEIWPEVALTADADVTAVLAARGIDSESVVSLLPATAMQASMMFHSQFNEGSRAYVDLVHFTLPANVDPIRLERAWSRCIDRHEALRSIVLTETPNPCVAVLHAHPAAWKTTSDQGHDAAAIEAAIDRERLAGFPAHLPPFRLHLLQGNDDRWHLFFVFHHAILDGWSIPVLLADVTRFYNEADAVLPEPPAFSRYLGWLEARDPQPAMDYWHQRLGDFKTCPPLFGHVASTSVAIHQNEAHLALSSSLMDDLQQFGAARALTLNTLFLSMWAILVARCTDTDDVVVGTTAGGRPSEVTDSDTMVGMFLNNLPLRTQIDPDSAVLSWLHSVQETSVRDRAFEWFPLNDIVSQSGIQRGNNLFECAFTFENYPANTWLEHGFLGTHAVSEYEETGIALSLKVELGQCPRLILQYDRDRFDATDAAKIMERLRDLCTLLVRRPSAKTGEFLAMAHPGTVAQAEIAALIETSESVPEPARALATDTERRLAELWAEVLDADAVDAGSNFFQLGGHSLLANRIMFLIERAFGKRLPIQALFESPYLARLAERIDTAESLVAAAEERVSPGQPVPLSFGQERLWFLQRMQPDNGVYNVPAAFEIEGPLDSERLTAAFQALVTRHAALRTAFTFGEDNRPCQMERAQADAVILETDLAHLPKQEAEQTVRQTIDGDTLTPFNLENTLLWRARLFRLAPDRHVFYLNLHHLITDGWSQGLLYRELSALYRGQELALPSWQHTDEAVAQRAALAGDAGEKLKAFWLENLADVPSELNLNPDLPRPKTQTFRAGEYVRPLNSETFSRLGEAMRGTSTTPFMMLSAAYALLLGRYANQDDLCIGTAVAGRDQARLEHTIGFFVRTVLLRYRFKAWQDRGDLFDHARQIVQNAMAHQALPFEHIVDLIKPERNPARAPLFQALFTLESHSAAKPDLPDMQVRTWELAFPVAKFELSLVIQEHGSEREAHWEYNRDLFKESTIARMANHYERLLSALADSANRAPLELDFLAPAERHQLLHGWNDTARRLPAINQHALVADWARKLPSKRAVVDPDQVTTYGELDGEANQVARWLTAHGVKPGSRVGLATRQDVTSPLMMLATLKCGAAYVPLDSQLPAPRLTSMIGDTGVALVIAEKSEPDRFNNVPIEGIATVRSQAAELSREPFNRTVPGDALSNIMFTSGSTGRPKAIGLTHTGLIRLCCNQHFLPVTTEDVIAQIAPIGFDASNMEIWAALLNGASVVTIPDRAMETVPRVLRETETTISFLTTRLFNVIVEDSVDALAKVRLIITGGEAMSMRHASKCVEALGEDCLLQAYGPTENSVLTTTCPVTHTSATPFSEPIGLPLSNTSVHIVDRQFRLVPIGVSGELVTGGLGLAHGYLGQPGRTATVFVPNPFATEPGERLYRTGDLVNRLADGRIAFQGRIDFQVKLRGFRIEPAEVETVLKEDTAVAKAVSLVMEDRAGDQHLMAFTVAANADSRPPTSELRARIAERLPRYMVPAFITWLDALPLTANGKLDRKALPGPDDLRAQQQTGVVPLAPAETLIGDIWGTVLGLETVRAEDNFFDLGGHSLAMIQVHGALKKQTNLDIPMVKLFEFPTVAGLAAYVARLRTSDAGSTESPAAEPDTADAGKARAEARKQARKRRRGKRS